MQFSVQFHLDYIELRNVWKQEEYHQHERGFLCWGGPIQVQVSALSAVSRHSLVPSSGCLLRRPAPLLYPRLSLPRYLKGMRDQCGIGLCDRCVYSAVAHGLSRLFWAAVRPAFKQFLPAWCLSFLSDSDTTQGPAFRRTLPSPSFACNQLCFTSLLLLVSHLQFS